MNSLWCFRLHRTAAAGAGLLLFLIGQAASMCRAGENEKFESGLWWIPGTGIHMRGLNDAEFQSNYLPGLDKTLTENKLLKGMYIALVWDYIEIEEGRYTWDRYDKIIEIARKHQTPYKLTLMPGLHTPKWVYEKGGAKFQAKAHGAANNPNYANSQKAKTGWAPPEYDIPIPWDETFQKYFYRITEAMKQRYGDDPLFVAVTIEIAHCQSGEWHLPKSDVDIRQWEKYPGYKEKIKQCWISAIDRFAGLFPRQQLVLECTSTPLNDMEREADEILEHGIAKYPGRFTIQTNSLTGQSDNTNASWYQRILKYEDRIHNGFQCLAGMQQKGAPWR